MTDRFERGDDLGECDFFRRGGELEPSLWPPCGLQDSGPYKGVQRLGEVVPGTVKHAGDFIDSHGALVGTGGDAQDGVNGLLRGAGEPHRIGFLERF